MKKIIFIIALMLSLMASGCVVYNPYVEIPFYPYHRYHRYVPHHHHVPPVIHRHNHYYNHRHYHHRHNYW